MLDLLTAWNEGWIAFWNAHPITFYIVAAVAVTSLALLRRLGRHR